MAETISSEPFHALAAALREGGFTPHAERLERVLNGVWTTSSGLVGELGRTVVEIRKECKPLSPAQKALVKQCLREVRKAWPGFGLFNWLAAAVSTALAAAGPPPPALSAAAMKAGLAGPFAAWRAVEETNAVCWQYSSAQQRFVKLGKWVI